MQIDITDASDPRLVDFVGLRDAQLRRGEERFIAEGLKIIERAFRGRLPPALAAAAAPLAGRPEPLLERFADVPVYVATEKLIEKVSGSHAPRRARLFPTAPRRPTGTGCSGRADSSCARRSSTTPTPAPSSASPPGWAGTGCSSQPGGADPLYRRAIKSSMGASLELPWRRLDGDADLARLKEAGFRLVASTLSPRAVPLGDYQAPEKLALLLGTEGSGLSDACSRQPTTTSPSR